MPEDHRKVVMGLGNLLQHDEGFGVYALQSLQARLGAQPGLEYIEGGVMGLDLLPLVEDCSHLLLLDAVDAGKPAGTLVELSKEEIPLYTGVKLSQHQVTFQEVLALVKLRDRVPAHIRLLGVQPADLSFGMQLSPLAAEKMPAVLDRAVAILQSWGLLPDLKFPPPALGEG
jgi:hydrogenase maturation protease